MVVDLLSHGLLVGPQRRPLRLLLRLQVSLGVSCFAVSCFGVSSLAVSSIVISDFFLGGSGFPPQRQGRVVVGEGRCRGRERGRNGVGDRGRDRGGEDAHVLLHHRRGTRAGRLLAGGEGGPQRVVPGLVGDVRELELAVVLLARLRALAVDGRQFLEALPPVAPVVEGAGGRRSCGRR